MRTLLALLALPAAATGMVVEQPCCYELLHAAANFGPAYLPREGVRGELVEPRSASPYMCVDDGEFPDEFKDAVALVPRGGCRFLDKALLAQQKGARAVVVYNEQTMHEDALVRMTVDQMDYLDARLLDIPAVFISFRSYMTASELLEAGPVFVVINGTAETNPTDPAPLFLKSIVFMLELLCIIWSMVAVFYMITWLNLRYARRKRLEIVRKLPVRKYQAEAASDVEAVSDCSSDCSGAGGDGAGFSGAQRHPRHREHVRVPVIEETEMVENPGRPTKPITDYFAAENCVICICDFEDGETLTVLPCGHGYHKDCIEPWLISKSALCPICKQSILPSGDARSLDEIASSDEESSEQDSDGAQSRSVVVLVGGVMAIAVGTSLLYILELFDPN